MTFRRLASIFVLISANVLIGVYYYQARRPYPFFTNLENENLVWNMNYTNTRVLAGNNVTATNVTDHSVEVFPHPYRYTINNKTLCSEGRDHKGKLSLLILVCSAVHNIEQRKMIRETWGQPRYSDVKIGFLVGATPNQTVQDLVTKESLKYADVIQEDFLDSYWNLTLKSVMLLKWVTEHCSNVRFVMKTDDDMYVNVPNLLKTLEKLPVKEKVMYGTLFRKAKPNRNPSAKWYVPKNQFHGEVFPDYLSGTGYVISRDVIPTLFEVSSSLPFLVMEDVFITGLCASDAGVRRFNVKGFAHWKRLPTACAFKDAVTGHHVSVTDMRKIWTELQNIKLKCPIGKKAF